MTMRITHHGGGCCGIKQIAMLGYSPDENLYPFDKPEDKKKAKYYADQDARGGNVESSRNIYWFARPYESAGARFDAYLDFLKKHRPCSLVEVTIVPYEDSVAAGGDERYMAEYQADWRPFLKDRGFKMVNRFANSNSGNHIEVYHLVLEDPDWEYDGYHTSYYDIEQEEEEI